VLVSGAICACSHAQSSRANRQSHAFKPRFHTRNARNQFTQAPANRNRAVLFPAELKFLRFKNFFKKSIIQILVRFVLVVQLMMQIKFNFNNFASATAWQRASDIYAVAGGCDWPIQYSIAQFLLAGACVNSLRALLYCQRNVKLS